MDKQTQQLMFSSDSDEWPTPDDFYLILDNQFHFTLDPCSDAFNRKCAKHYTIADDGLSKSWEGETVFVNPPYSDIKEWVKKCYEEGQKPNTIVVMLIPSRTDTKYWHNYCMKANAIYFVKGRLKFGNSKNYAPFPSAVVVFTNIFSLKNTSPTIRSLDRNASHD